MANSPSRPVPPGTILGKVPRHSAQTGSKPTPLEQKLLEQAGASPGELVDLTNTAAAREARAAINRLRAEGTDENLIAHSPEFQRKQASTFRIPAEQALESLDAQHKAELQAAVQKFRSAEQTVDQPELPDFAYTTPGLAEAMLAAEQVKNVRPQPATPTATPASPATDEEFSQLLVGESAPAPPPAPAVPPPDPTVLAIQQQLERCPHCGFRLAEDPIAVTTEDKQQFLIAFHTGQRFRKAASLFDGRIQVIFRGLTPFENETIFEELDAQLIAGKLVPGMSYNRRWSDYRLVASIAAIQIAGGRPWQFKPLEELVPANGELTPLPRLLRGMYSKVLTTEPVLRTVAMEFARVQKTLEALESRATDPDFFSGIERAV
jgi:hypothetical protein